MERQMRTILHSDMNNCYASIELLHHPEFRGRPLAVGGDPEARHGIVLAKDQLAKAAGVKTGMALWQARQVCPDIVFVPPRMELYLRFSRLAREIYAEYTDCQEAFGVDESWLDVTYSSRCRGDGLSIAREINARVKDELGITVSIGVSWNKIFAKFGSDYKKPDAITVIDRDNYRDIVWTKPAEDLLYVGRSTRVRLNRAGIFTIGDIARSDPEYLHRLLGKMGYVLHMFATGEDQTPVNNESYEVPVKSIGNSTTTPRDLVCDQDVKIIIYVLAESVSARLRENNFRCNVVEISVRDNGLFTYTKQTKIERSTDITEEIAVVAYGLFRASYDWHSPIRSVGVRACDLVESTVPVQLDMFSDEDMRQKKHDLDQTIDEIRNRFGYRSVQRGMMYLDRSLSSLNAKEDNTVHPHSYFEDGNRTGSDRYGT
ncbi:MAG: DNA polymerase IV [Clostridiales bacterium]|nr:DNA polymerase IV [Clostridiales bacterium]